jgi:hypothetical protein
MKYMCTRVIYFLDKDNQKNNSRRKTEVFLCPSQTYNKWVWTVWMSRGRLNTEKSLALCLYSVVYTILSIHPKRQFGGA